MTDGETAVLALQQKGFDVFIGQKRDREHKRWVDEIHVKAIAPGTKAPSDLLGALKANRDDAIAYLKEVERRREKVGTLANLFSDNDFTVDAARRVMISKIRGNL